MTAASKSSFCILSYLVIVWKELHVFKFKDGPLGIEVQLKNGKVGIVSL